MGYLGTPPRSRVLSSADIATGAVTLDDISFTDQPTSVNVSGAINKHTMRLSDEVVIDGDLNITDNLILSKISDDGNAITLTTDGSTRTITGTGSLEASTLTATPNSSLTGMTGEIGSAVTGTLGSGVTIGSGVTFPSGMIIKRTILYFDEPSSHINVAGTSFVDTGVAGSFTVKNSSANSYLVFHLSSHLSHLSSASGTGYNTMTLKSSSSTTYSADDDVLGSQTMEWKTLSGTPAMAQTMTMYYKAGTNVSTNLSSYSAGATLYARMFMKSNSGVYAYFFAHSNAGVIYYVDEVQI